MSTEPVIKRALISTSNKNGIVEFSKQLSSFNIEILATGGTARLLLKNNVNVVEIADYTSQPEIMDGRLKTLHPKVFGGLLGRTGLDDVVMKEQGILPIQLLVVNLYPFEQTIAKTNCPFSDAIEQIDIGGPSLLRAGAKNHQFVTVIVDPNDYSKILDEIKQHGNTSLSTRRVLASKVFQHTAHYDAVIADYFSKQEMNKNESIESDTLFPQQLNLKLNKFCDLRYGENPQQKAALYIDQKKSDHFANTKQRQGKMLSFNNLVDGDAAIDCIRYFDPKIPACAIIKHATPCGVALGSTLKEAYELALRTDPESAFGGIIAVNQCLDQKTAETMIQKQFIELLVAPNFTQEALTLLKTKPNLRVLALDNILPHDKNTLHLKCIFGGMLVQQIDDLIHDENMKIVTKQKPNEQQWNDLLFAWKVVAMVKSNAIVYAKNSATLGIGSGQTSRVFSAKIAKLKADDAALSLKNSIMASDAFLPFKDTVDLAAMFGVKAIIQPGGSKRDQEVIDAANEANIAMIFTGTRHFRH